MKMSHTLENDTDNPPLLLCCGPVVDLLENLRLDIPVGAVRSWSLTSVNNALFSHILRKLVEDVVEVINR